MGLLTDLLNEEPNFMVLTVAGKRSLVISWLKISGNLTRVAPQFAGKFNDIDAARLLIKGIKDGTVGWEYLICVGCGV